MSKKRVMIIEDSEVVRQLLEHIIGSDERLAVAASVTTAEEALRLLPSVKPDVISMDINLPGMDGLEATHRIMTDQPTPIVIVSSSVADRDAQTSLDALRAGALAVSEKPIAPGQPQFATTAKQLCNRLVLMSEVSVIRQRQGRDWRPRGSADAPGGAAASGNPLVASPGTPDSPAGPSGIGAGAVTPRFLAVVASTGGPQALVRLFQDLGPDFPLPVLLVQHITAAFVDSFAGWLRGVTRFPVTVAADGMTPQPGHVYLAPADCHLTLDFAPDPRLRLTGDPPVSGQRPSGTVLLESLARSSAAAATVGVVLTGMGDDGARGLLSLREAGGYTIAEDASSAVVYGMPGAAVALGAAETTLNLADIGGCVRRLARAAQAGTGPESGSRERR